MKRHRRHNAYGALILLAILKGPVMKTESMKRLKEQLGIPETTEEKDESMTPEEVSAKKVEETKKNKKYKLKKKKPEVAALDPEMGEEDTELTPPSPVNGAF